MVHSPPLLKGMLGICGTAGAALTVAASLGNSTSAETVLTQVDAGNSEGRATAKTFKFAKCEGSKQGRAEVSFGETSIEDICWESELDIQSEAELNSLLNEEWGDSRKWEDQYSLGDWKLSCERYSPGWDIWNTRPEGDETKEYYLGLCNGKELKDTLFIFKKQEKGGATVSVCRGDCWESSRADTHTTVAQKTKLDSARENQFKKVNFYNGGFKLK